MRQLGPGAGTEELKEGQAGLGELRQHSAGTAEVGHRIADISRVDEGAA